MIERQGFAANVCSEARKLMMARTRLILGITAMAFGLAAVTQVRAGNEKTFLGEIADTQCALNVHSLSRSHKEMIAMKPEVKTNADCARYCVRERGGKFVLQTKDYVYKLDAQVLAEQWAGLRVRVIGTLDPKTDLITVSTIESASAGAPARPK
jgi:hypothetical protein